MTKAELLKELEKYPDDIEIFVLVGAECDELVPLEYVKTRNKHEWIYKARNELNSDILHLGAL